MRQIGTLPKGPDPKVLTDHLFSLGIKARLDERPEGWDVWIFNEDQVALAHDELREYLSRPDDPRFRASAPTAAAIRRKQEDLDKQYRKNFREASDLWAVPGFRRRPITSLLVAACIVIFILQRSSQGSVVEQRLFFSSYERQGGERRSHGLDDIQRGEVWRLITPILMHGNILHLLFNMSWLTGLGTMIEIRRGTLRLAGLVLIAAVISNTGQFLYMEQADPGEAHPFYGMSGVVYALFGYVWMKGLYEPEQRMIMHPNGVLMMMMWLFLCMTDSMSSLIGPVANAAHVMGLVVGVTLGVFRY